MIPVNTIAVYPQKMEPINAAGKPTEVASAKGLPQDLVSISTDARMKVHAEAVMPPFELKQATFPSQEEKLEQIDAVKKSIAMYQAVSQIHDGKLSLTEAYIVKNNENVRQAYVAKEQKAHNQSLIAAYQSGQDMALNYYA